MAKFVLFAILAIIAVAAASLPPSECKTKCQGICSKGKGKDGKETNIAKTKCELSGHCSIKEKECRTDLEKNGCLKAVGTLICDAKELVDAINDLFVGLVQALNEKCQADGGKDALKNVINALTMVLGKANEIVTLATKIATDATGVTACIETVMNAVTKLIEGLISQVAGLAKAGADKAAEGTQH
jgi:hypothetical protein